MLLYACQLMTRSLKDQLKRKLHTENQNGHDRRQPEKLELHSLSRRQAGNDLTKRNAQQQNRNTERHTELHRNGTRSHRSFKERVTYSNPRTFSYDQTRTQQNAESD